MSTIVNKPAIRRFSVHATFAVTAERRQGPRPRESATAHAKTQTSNPATEIEATTPAGLDIVLPLGPSRELSGAGAGAVGLDVGDAVGDTVPPAVGPNVGLEVSDDSTRTQHAAPSSGITHAALHISATASHWQHERALHSSAPNPHPSQVCSLNASVQVGSSTPSLPFAQPETGAMSIWGSPAHSLNSSMQGALQSPHSAPMLSAALE